MRRRLAEETIIFISVFKWFFLATCVGTIVGASTFAFLKILKWSISLAGSASPYYFFLLPFSLFVSALIIKYVEPDAGGYGTEKVIEAVHKRYGKVKAMMIPVKLVATVLTLASGGSVGNAGPCAQIGSGLMSIVGDIFRFNDIDRKKFVVCGVSAGFASIFGAPIAGAIFGIEVLFVGGIMYDILLPSFVAGIVGYQVANVLGVTYPQFTVDFVPAFTETFFIEVAFAGVFFGLCSFFFIEVMQWGRNLTARSRIWMPLWGLIGGAALVVLALIFSTDYLGLGEQVVETALSGGDVVWYAFILKMLFTVITFSSGGTGGIITPIFFIGATAGALYGTILGLDTATFSAIGLVSLLAGAANTPITGSIMAVELFGPHIAPFAAIACIISFLMTGYRSIFPSQVVALKKSASIDVELGKEIEGIMPQFHKRKRTLVDVLWRIGKRLKEKMDKHPPHG